MNCVRLGIIGCGVIGKNHLGFAAKCPNTEVVALADLMEDRAKALAAEFDIASVYNNEDDLLNDKNVDAVILALPTGVRTPIACKALERGKHVLLEKPVASKACEVEKMMEMRGDLVVACCSARHVFRPHAQVAAKCFASGVLGKLRMVRVRAVLGAPAGPNDAPPLWRESMRQNGGGILVNWSSYDLNYLMHITGWQLKPKSLMAKWWQVSDKMAAHVAPGSDADAHYIALINCEDDIVLSMERGEFTSTRTNVAWEIIGEEGSLHMAMWPHDGFLDEVTLDKFVPGEGVVTEKLWEKGQEEETDDVVSDFARAIQEGKEPTTNLERALVMQKITDAIYASAESGTSVSIQ